MNKIPSKQHIVVDIGPLTTLMIAELALIVFKFMNYISFSWLIVLSPILLLVTAAALIILYTLLKLIKDSLF